MDTLYQEKWESRSSLRTRPRKPIDFTIAGDYFPIDKQVLFLLPEVSDVVNQKKEAILILSFYNYLQDIIGLESDWVYAACNSILQKELKVTFTADMKLNATTIVMDEYYHIYLAYDYMYQLKAQYPELPVFNNYFSDSHHAMVTIKDRLDRPYRELFEILAVCIFETTLIRELVNYFDSPTIHPTIKYYINDHMNDESRHFVFFHNLMRFIWESLPEDYQQNIGGHLGDFVTLYLNIEGEKRFNKQLLGWVLNNEKQASDLIDKIYRGFQITHEIPIVKNVLNVLTKANILSHEAVRNGFKKNNLIAQ